MKAGHAADLPAALLAAGSRLSCPRDAAVFRTGGTTHSVFYVESGAVRLLRFGRQGEEVVLHEARPGEFFAEASLDSPRYHCDAVAAEASVLLKIPAPALRELLESDPALARQWIGILSRQLRSARARIERLSLKGARERVLHLLLSEGRGAHCELALEGTLKDLARRLGLSHEVLYRTLAAMQRAGEIERGDGVLRRPG